MSVRQGNNVIAGGNEIDNVPTSGSTNAVSSGGVYAALTNKADKGHEVIDFQEPTAANNYTWYRKYADGWVEQGGNVNGGTSQTATFPIEMADTHYTVAYGNVSGTYEQVRTSARTTTSITIRNANNSGTVSTDWQVSGLSAN